MTIRVIQAEKIYKNYKVKKRQSALSGFFKDLLFPQYAVQKALNGISLEINAGECLGYLGPNGAGKSTLIKILCGLQYPTSGRVSVLGHNPFLKERSFLKRIGVVLGHKSSLWWDLPTVESFKAHQKLYGICDRKYENNMEELCSAFNLGSVLSKPVRVLSLGERVKSELAMNLLHDPELLFLDEPTVGLDLQSKSELRKYINKMVRTRNLAVFLTSHDLGDIDSCCDRVMLTNNGNIEFSGTIDDLKASLVSSFSVSVSTKDTLFLEENQVSLLKSVLASYPEFLVETARPPLETLMMEKFTRMEAN